MSILHKRDSIRLVQTNHKIKTMTKMQKILHLMHRRPRTRAFIFGVVLVLTASFVLPVFNDRISANSCTSISDCQEKIANSTTALASLRETALSYQDAINQLSAQISMLQGSIDTNVAEQNRLQGEIDKAQAEIDRQRNILAEGVKAMYVDGTPSTLEMVVTSKNLNEYVDKAEYRTAVQRKLQETMKKIGELQKQLSVQKAQVSDLLKQQQEQQNQLVAARAEQNEMLAYNKSQQDSFSADVAANRSKLNALIEEQRRANTTTISRGGLVFVRVPGQVNMTNVNVDDYPYKYDGFSMQLGPCSDYDSYPDRPDRWGYCTRQCVSYVAWAVERSGRTAPKYWGNAKDWVNHAPGSWIHSTPKPGDIAVSTSGTWGHVMYVEAVEGDRMLISQYNAGLRGEYSTAWIKY